MNLNKMFVLIFVFFVVFSALLVTMPSNFKILGVEADVQDKEVREYFDEHDITAYNQTYSIDPLEYTVYDQSAFGLPEGQMLEFYWDFGVLAVNHLTHNLWGWWYGWHVLEIMEPYATIANIGEDQTVNKEQLLLLFDDDYNASYYECSCEHVAVKLFVMTYNQSWTLSESWDNHKLKIFTSYDVDWTATGVSMWHVMMQLLAFQNPNLGIPGIGGTILTLGFGGALWASIAVLSFALITSVIPFIRGWVGGG